MARITATNLRAFLNRDWSAARRAKDEAMGRWVRAHGATAAFGLAQLLLDQVWEQVRHDRARRTDVSGLVKLRETFARAQAALDREQAAGARRPHRRRAPLPVATP